MNADEIEYIQQLKAGPFTGMHVKVSDSEEYKIKILNRGEQLFYQQNDRAFICQIQALHNLVYRNSIRKWDDNKRITPEEKVVIEKRIEAYLKSKGADVVQFV